MSYKHEVTARYLGLDNILDAACTEVDRLRAEVESLRAGLRQVIEGVPEYDDIRKEFFHDHSIPADEGPSIEYLNSTDIIFSMAACAAKVLHEPARAAIAKTKGRA